MGELTPEQRTFDVSIFFDADAQSGEPRDRQIRDPETGTVYGPGLKVTEDGQVQRTKPKPDLTGGNGTLN